MGVCTKERKGVTAAVLMATPCTLCITKTEKPMKTVEHANSFFFFYKGQSWEWNLLCE